MSWFTFFYQLIVWLKGQANYQFAISEAIEMIILQLLPLIQLVLHSKHGLYKAYIALRHYNDITCAPWRLNSPAVQHFALELVLANNKDIVKAFPCRDVIMASDEYYNQQAFTIILYKVYWATTMPCYKLYAVKPCAPNGLPTTIVACACHGLTKDSPWNSPWRCPGP